MHIGKLEVKRLFKCPFCKLDAAEGYDEETGKRGVLHTEPTCEAFDEMTAAAYSDVTTMAEGASEEVAN